MGRLRPLLFSFEFGLLLVCAVLAVIFRSLSPTFLSPASLSIILRGMAFLGIVLIGQVLLMISGELDLSVGSIAGFSAVVAAWLVKTGGWPPSVGIALGILAGAFVGTANGLLAVGIGIPAFIATLGVAFIVRGFSYLICNGYPIYPLPRELGEFGRSMPFGLSWPFFIFLTLAVVADILVRFTVFGRHIHATGGNPSAAFRSGIRTGRLKLSCFLISGALSGLAGVLLMCQLGSGQPEIGNGWELEVISSVVIGGVSLFGGRGTVIGAILGLFLIQLTRNGLLTTGASPHWQIIVMGTIMIIAVGMDIVRQRVLFRN